ncbi:MAG: hypothetical protein WBC33_01970 [Conexibacter sp.]
MRRSRPVAVALAALIVLASGAGPAAAGRQFDVEAGRTVSSTDGAFTITGVAGIQLVRQHPG